MSDVIKDSGPNRYVALFSTLLGMVLICSCGSRPSEKDHGGPPPNVLFIAVDDLNDWVGVLGGHPQTKTPNIDRLAQQGTVFLNAHTQSPICNPSRTSVLTGLRPSTTGIYGLSPWIRDVPGGAEITTLPQYFKKHGYRTLAGGKIYHGGYGRKKGTLSLMSWVQVLA